MPLMWILVSTKEISHTSYLYLYLYLWGGQHAVQRWRRYRHLTFTFTCGEDSMLSSEDAVTNILPLPLPAGRTACFLALTPLHTSYLYLYLRGGQHAVQRWRRYRHLTFTFTCGWTACCPALTPLQTSHLYLYLRGGQHAFLRWRRYTHLTFTFTCGEDSMLSCAEAVTHILFLSQQLQFRMKFIT